MLRSSSRALRTASLAGAVALGLTLVGCSGKDNGSSPIVPTPEDETPPMTPSSLTAGKNSETAASFAWLASADADVAGYRIYVFDPDPWSTANYRLLNESTLVTGTAYSVRIEQCPEGFESVYVRVSAVDTSGNESGLSEPLGVEFATPDWTPTDPGDQGGSGGGHTD